jgi:hypothetical protein
MKTAEEILEYCKSLKGIPLGKGSDGKFAEFLGISTATYSAMKKRNSINHQLIIEKFSGYDLNKIFEGKSKVEQIVENENQVSQKVNLEERDKVIENLHDTVIETKTEARIYREIVDKYFMRLESTMSKMVELTSNKATSSIKQDILANNSTKLKQEDMTGNSSNAGDAHMDYLKSKKRGQAGKPDL